MAKSFKKSAIAVDFCLDDFPIIIRVENRKHVDLYSLVNKKYTFPSIVFKGHCKIQDESCNYRQSFGFVRMWLFYVNNYTDRQNKNLDVTVALLLLAINSN